MKIEFSSHALERLREREIDRDIVFRAIQNPDKVELSKIKRERFLLKKIYYHWKLQKDHLLIIVCEKQGNIVEVITIIDTSKISKYF